MAPPDEKQAMDPAAASTFSRYQLGVVALIAALQFTIILDFMVLSPLGAILMPALQMSPQQFGSVVSAYAFSAGLSGLLASGFADRVDRKRFLLFFYTGFLIGTLLCGLATSYEFLLAARVVTGLFGGVVGSISFAIITDVFEPRLRGRVMGIVQTAFSASQVLGLPLSLYLANHLGWHAPFIALVGVGLALGAAVTLGLRPVRAHLNTRRDGGPFQHVVETVSNPLYLQAFATTALLSIGGFMLMPFGSAFSVRNLGLTLDQLPFVYLVTGLCSIATGPLVGRLTDTWGGLRVFTLGSALALIMVLVYTHLGVTPLVLVIATSVLLFTGISARMISSQALISTIPAPQSRGSFMAVSSSVQQFSGGVAASVAGLIIVAPETGPLEHFDVLGFVIAGATLITLALMHSLSRRALAQPAAQAQPASVGSGQ
ncbi:MAG: MFS transporter [Myxococcaceae bacterium]